jgi:hypothetical protein
MSEASDLVTFITAAEVRGRVGEDEQYGKVRDYFTRSKEEIGGEIDTLVTQMQDFVQRLSVRVQLFELHEVGFELGFSAEGHLGFIAKAGAHGTVHVTFTRKAPSSSSDQGDLRCRGRAFDSSGATLKVG